MAPHISKLLHASERTLLVDVFGGSGVVVMNAGFRKRVYNDLDGDLVNMFEVISCRYQRRALLGRAKYTPISRKVFDNYRTIYKKGGLSFRLIEDPVERALAIFYLGSFSFGGKIRSGGFQISGSDRDPIKEVSRWHNRVKAFAKLGEFWMHTVIENKHYQDMIRIYGKKRESVLYCDPPYDGTENYYSVEFTKADHTFLAHQLSECSSPAVVSYYDTPLIRSLYKEDIWTYHKFDATKNTARCNRFTPAAPKSDKSVELLITKGITV
jgi:DNA adenine methylase